MKRETIAIHAGYEQDAAAQRVRYPIYQTVAYAFDSAEHAAGALQPGSRGLPLHADQQSHHGRAGAAHGRRSQGGLEAMCVATGPGRSELRGAQPRRHGQQRRLAAAALRYDTHAVRRISCRGRACRCALPSPTVLSAIERLIDAETRAIFCESVGNPAGNICDIEALAQVAHRHGIPLVVDNTVATPMLLRPIEYGADIVVHSLTKFMGGHGTTLGGVIVDGGNFPWAQHAARFPMFCEPDHSYHGLVYTERFGRAAYIARCRSRYLRTGAVARAAQRLPAAAGSRDRGAARRAPRQAGRKVAEFLARPTRDLGQLRRLSRQSILRAGAEVPQRAETR